MATDARIHVPAGEAVWQPRPGASGRAIADVPRLHLQRMRRERLVGGFGQHGPTVVIS